MKNNLFIISLLSILTFVNCESNHQNIDNQSIELKKGLIINSDINIQQQDYQLLANEENEKIITIEGDNLTLDFKNIALIGTSDFTKPDKFKGVAVHIKNSKFVTIKNLNISGYKIALQVDNVQDLTIDSCNFSYNYRADSSASFDINKVEIGAVILNNSKDIQITNSTISHNYNALVLNNSTIEKLKNCLIQFNSKVGLYFNHSFANDIYLNNIDWNLVAGNWHIGKVSVIHFYSNSITHNGSVQLTQLNKSMNEIKYSEIITDESFDSITIELFHIEGASERGLSPKLDPKYPKGEAYKLPTKYGVYDFGYPAIFLRTVNEKEYTFAMFGPSVGNWKFVASENVASANLKTGTFPATFIIKKIDLEKPFSLSFEFIGERFRDEFGVWNEKGKVYKFGL